MSKNSIGMDRVLSSRQVTSPVQTYRRESDFGRRESDVGRRASDVGRDVGRRESDVGKRRTSDTGLLDKRDNSSSSFASRNVHSMGRLAGIVENTDNPENELVWPSLFYSPKVNPSLEKVPSSYDALQVIHTSKSFYLNTELLTDAFGFYTLTRTMYVFMGESNTLSWDSIKHFLMVFIPFYISLRQLFGLHDHQFAQSDLHHFVYTGFRISFVLGLAWTAPSVYASTSNDLVPFCLFVLMCRALIACTFIIVAWFESLGTKRLLLSSVCMMLPISLWASTLFVKDMVVVKTLVGWAGLSDLLIQISLDLLQVMMEVKPPKSNDRSSIEFDGILHGHYSLWIQESRTRIIFQTFILIALGVQYVFEFHPDVEYLNAIMNVPFGIFDFLLGVSGVVLLYLLFSIYKNVFGWRVFRFVTNYPFADAVTELDPRTMPSTTSQTSLGKAIEWIHLPLHASLLILFGSLALQMPVWYRTLQGFDGFIPALPLNATLFNIVESDVAISLTGVSYLQAALNAQGVLTGSSLFVQGSMSTQTLFLLGSGAFGVCITILGFCSTVQVIQDQYKSSGLSDIVLLKVALSRIWKMTVLRLFMTAILFTLAGFGSSVSTYIGFILGFVGLFLWGWIEEVYRLRTRVLT